MTITPKLNDALAAVRHASAPLAATGQATAPAATGMAPISLTPLAPPRVGGTDQSASTADRAKQDALPGMVPTMHRELFDRSREALLEQLSRRDFGALPPSWAAISGRLSQEEAASAAAALQLIAARVSP